MLLIQNPRSAKSCFKISSDIEAGFRKMSLFFVEPQSIVEVPDAPEDGAGTIAVTSVH